MSNLVLNSGASAHEPGFFGKIPARGDFVSRRLGPGLVQPLDEWLQASIATSRRQMGEGWLPSYLETPIWRFVLGPGVCGEVPLAGVLMPSVDRVGRYFPLVLAAPLPGCVAPIRLIETARGWFDKVEALALSSLEDGFVFDRFDQALRTLGAPPYDTTRPAANGANGLRVGLDDDGKVQNGQLADTYGRLLDQVLIGFNNRFSLWWTSGSDRVASSLLIAPGLPAPQNFAAFMDGHWEEWGWERPADSVLHLDDAELPILLLRPVVPMPCHGRTHPGTRRGANQDALLMREDIGLWCVADGLGGHSDGEVASATVVATLDNVLPPLSYAGFVDDVRDALTEANGMLRDRARTLDEQAVVASTAVVLLVYANRISCLWAGDSRVYRLRDGVIQQLTSDHVAAGMGNNQRSTMLVTRAVGAADTLEVDMMHDAALPGDRFLLCSDGVTKVLRDAEIAQMIKGLPPRDAVDALVENVLVSGAPDNLTAIIVDIPADMVVAQPQPSADTGGEAIA
ncbi:type VI secretion system-associated protein TagF [Niveispirillum sp. SYP-B3756]|uniref:type VI secretion system-associated protein TagF n=1 Tax=Niveispirillum sp. SYP-B3756 TaxID=2662178 RepID=UPI00129296D9|nr:type VI secretion system-associated protein TagF [Niveispirillum sp. SYP-B3756]MQP66268.1 type VI secretion system-associated protein TagF [Niveispirillum sp. SYP-B3756]